MINEALYSFLCQTLPSYKIGDLFHHKSFESTINGIIDSIHTGTHICIGDPELFASQGEFITEAKTDTLKWHSDASYPPDFPYQTLCLWHNPVAVDMGSMVDPIRHQHLMCIRRITPNVVYINYALCQQERDSKNISRTIGEMDYSWIVIPYGVLFFYPIGTNKINIPTKLPENLESDYRLKEKIKSLSCIPHPNHLEFISLCRDGENRKNLTLAMNYYIPGILVVLMGFLEKLNGLKLDPMIEPKIEINNTVQKNLPEVLPELTYYGISK